MKLCAVIAFLIPSICGTAQTTSKQDNSNFYYAGSQYVQEIYRGEGANKQIVQRRFWDSKGDYDNFTNWNNNTDLIYGVGEASGKANEGGYIKREAQDLAYDQIAGQLKRQISKFHEDMRIRGENNGNQRNDNTITDGVSSITQEDLPPAVMQYCYHYQSGGESVYVVGVAISRSDLKKMNEKKEDNSKGYTSESDNENAVNKMNAKFNSIKSR